MWFETLTGFQERPVDKVAARFIVDGSTITSRSNNRTMHFGRFETPSLGELRDRRRGSRFSPAASRVRLVVGDVQKLHTDPANAGALFQAASQFNTLEMTSPDVTPEAGIDGYENDHTQGPACAIACGAGTIYRNYLVHVDGGVGQSANRQVNCLSDLAGALGVEIPVRNGYALPSAAQLDAVSNRLAGVDDVARDSLMAELRIGLQWNTEVTLRDVGHLVTQAYCSAVPIGYSEVTDRRCWEPLARLVLDAAYEATLCAAVVNADATGNRTVFLTSLGGGVFQNERPWIASAIERAVRVVADVNLDVMVVSRGTPSAELQALVTAL